MTALPKEDVQKYPRPPALERVEAEVVVHFAGTEIVRTNEAWRVLETHHAPTYYVPEQMVTAVMTLVSGSSFCEWKGRAQYFDISVGDVTARRAAWSYPRPTRGFLPIAGHLAFYAWAMERCSVGGVDVVPQPGDFYGGWVTPNLIGIVKGGPGTEHW